MSLRLLACFCYVAVTSDACAVAQERPDSRQMREMEQLIERLGSPRFEERTVAQRELIGWALEHPDSIEALLQAPTDVETTLRIVQAVEAVFAGNEDSIGDRAEQALMAVSASGTGIVSALSGCTLRRHGRLRERRAREALEKLGAEVSYVTPFTRGLQQVTLTAPVTGVGCGPPVVLQGIWLHEDWRGETSDLWHLGRFSHLPDLMLYTIRGNRIPIPDLLQYGSQLPGVTINERGPCLGIKNSPFLGNACVIGAIIPGSAAAKANLKPQDEITALNGALVRSFAHLVSSLQSFGVGQTVTLTIVRNQVQMDVDVELSSWRGIPQGDEMAVPAPGPFLGPFAAPPSTPRPVPLPVAIPN